VPITKLYFNYS